MRKSLALLVAAFLSGCGTVRNLASSDPEPYGGVVKDGQFFSLFGKPAGPITHPAGVVVLAALYGACLGEVGASFVGDTLTLPITRAIEARNHPEKQAEKAEWIDGPVQYSPNVPEDAVGMQ
jgi:uncharacterized protein YceK